jgi:hypothetical protein
MTNLLQSIAHALHVAYILLPWVILAGVGSLILRARCGCDLG